MNNNRAANNAYEFSYTMKIALHKKIRKIVFFIFIMFLCITLFIKFLFFTTVISSDSMAPNYNEYDFVVVNALQSPNTKIFEDYVVMKRGDVVFLRPLQGIPQSFFTKIINSVVSFFTLQRYSPYSDSKEMISQSVIRRIVGLPGDTVYMDNYTLYIKPAGSVHFLTEFELSEKQYDIQLSEKNDSGETLENFDMTLGAMGDMPEIVLDNNEYFLLCDKRYSGIDSRLWGPVSANKIKGKVILRYFPFNKFSLE